MLTKTDPHLAWPAAGSALVPGESVVEVEGLTFPRYYRPAGMGRPLVLFMTGGCHLARVAYGHPGAHAPDFLDHWLAVAGTGLLAPSYPSSHQVCPSPQPDLDIPQWADAVATLTARELGPRLREQPVLLCGWSMGGKTAGAVTAALRAKGCNVSGFVSLAATPPIANTTPRRDTPEAVNTAGLWDVDRSGRRESWLQEIAAIGEAQGRPVMSAKDYRRCYACDTPLGLRGESLGAHDTAPLALFDPASFPLCAAIVPTRASDAHHALTDAQAWSFITSRGVFARLPPEQLAALPPTAWRALRSMTTSAGRDLTRHMDAGHFLLLGEPQARACAGHILELGDKLARFAARLQRLLAPARGN